MAHTLLAVLAIAASLSSVIASPPLVFVWNASSSVPRGLYRVDRSGEIRRGDFVAAWLPHAARKLADERRYVPASLPIVKEVAALGGDRVCARGATLRIAHEPKLRRLSNDPSGRSLPWWNGCRLLAAHELMLLGSSRLSFDGRYFGPVRLENIIGRAVPMWTL